MRIGAIGTGNIVSWFMKSTSLAEDIEYTAVYSRKQETGDRFARENDLEKVYTDLDLMLKDKDIDAIYVASPNSLHYEHAKACLLAGKHVLLEKPFTGNVAKAKELIKLAQDKKLILMEAICNLHLPHMEYIKRRIPELGQMKMVQANFSQYSSRYNNLLEGKIENVFKPEMSGGALADINIYNLHFTMYLFGTPKKVHYYANQHENGIDTSGVLILDYGEFKASLVAAKDSFSHNLIQVQGDNGYLLIPSAASHLESVVFETHETRKDFVEQDKPHLYYQIETFKEMVNNQDFKRRDTLLKHSLEVVKVAVLARKQIGLDFEF